MRRSKWLDVLSGEWTMVSDDEMEKIVDTTDGKVIIKAKLLKIKKDGLIDYKITSVEKLLH